MTSLGPEPQSMETTGTTGTAAVAAAAPRNDTAYLQNLGVSVHWLQTNFFLEVETFCAESPRAEPSCSTVSVYEIEPWLRQKGASVTCPLDKRKGSSYVHALWVSHDPARGTCLNWKG